MGKSTKSNKRCKHCHSCYYFAWVWHFYCLKNSRHKKQKQPGIHGYHVRMTGTARKSCSAMCGKTDAQNAWRMKIVLLVLKKDAPSQVKAFVCMVTTVVAQLIANKCNWRLYFKDAYKEAQTP